tara:strand:+ start:1007 stop:1465 length:459 start_codon:yes stop_codon:yes gene_type:complete
MSNEYEDFSDNQPLTDDTQSEGSKAHEEATSKPYAVKNVKYGEKTVVGRVIGRNKVVIPEEEVAQLSQYHCTNKEMADFYNVPLQTFMDNFRDIIDKNRIITKQRLRKAQLDLALKGDRVMLIWLGKQMLGQSENPVSTESNQVLPWIDEDK